MRGLLILMATLAIMWPTPTIFGLLPATMLVGFGQAFIVSSFFRIGLSNIPRSHAGSGSALLSTVQQASYGMGPIILGTVLAQMLHATHGDYATALIASYDARRYQSQARSFHVSR